MYADMMQEVLHLHELMFTLCISLYVHYKHVRECICAVCECARVFEICRYVCIYDTFTLTQTHILSLTHSLSLSLFLSQFKVMAIQFGEEVCVCVYAREKGREGQRESVCVS